MRRSLSVLLVAMAAALAPVDPALAEGPVQSAAPGCVNDLAYEVCFNDPGSSDVHRREVIFTRLQQMIDFAVPGDEIRVAMFSWTGAGHNVAAALARAATRHVDVRVIVGSGASKTQKDFLTAAGIPVTVCQLACISKQAGSISHVKLFLLRLRGCCETLVRHRHPGYFPPVASGQDGKITS